jgi:hypothetical protein
MISFAIESFHECYPTDDGDGSNGGSPPQLNTGLSGGGTPANKFD